MQTSFDRLKILVIDDRPEDLLNKEVPPPWVPAVPQPEGEFFDVRWIATAGEGREFRDLSRRVGWARPRDLGSRGWVPEILVVDYSLTQEVERVEERLAGRSDLLDRVSPLPALRVLAAEAGHHCHRDDFEGNVGLSDENYGCFLGGLLLTTFSDHPCVPVTSTVRRQSTISGSYTAYFEWLLADESGGSLRAEGRVAGGWPRLLAFASPCLRRRIEELAKGSFIQISLDDLLKLSAGGSHDVLTVSSRYGRRQYPVRAFFLDQPADQRPAQAAAWARHILEQAWQGGEGRASAFESTIQELVRGRELADRLWSAYNDDERFDRRWRLSELAGRDRGANRDALPLQDSERKELNGLLTEFGVKDAGRPRASCERNWIDLRHPEYDGRARRWAVLMVLVQLLHRRFRALETDRAIWGRRARRAKFDASLESRVTPNDVYLALFPVPQTPLVLPWHSDSADPASSWKKYLTELQTEVDKSNGPGDLAIDLQDVLDGLGWGEHRTFGLFDHERPVLCMFAEAIGFGRDEWERDPLSSNVFLGAALRESKRAR